MVLVAIVGFLGREVALRYTSEPPRSAANPLPRGKPVGVERWDYRAALWLEKSEQVLRETRTLTARIEYLYTQDGWPFSRSECQLRYARPNRMRRATYRRGKLERIEVSDGWLLTEYTPNWRRYARGFSFPDGRGQDRAPLGGFFSDKLWEYSYAARVRRLLQRGLLTALTYEPQGQGARVTVTWRDERTHTLGLELDRDGLPIWVSELQLLWVQEPLRFRAPFTIPVVVGRWMWWGEAFAVRELQREVPIAPTDFFYTVPPEAQPMGETRRYERLLEWALGLRAQLVP